MDDFEGERGCKPKDVSSRWKLGEARIQILPMTLQKEAQPCQHPDLNPVRFMLEFDLKKFKIAR